MAPPPPKAKTPSPPASPKEDEHQLQITVPTPPAMQKEPDEKLTDNLIIYEKDDRIIEHMTTTPIVEEEIDEQLEETDDVVPKISPKTSEIITIVPPPPPPPEFANESDDAELGKDKELKVQQFRNNNIINSNNSNIDITQQQKLRRSVSVESDKGRAFSNASPSASTPNKAINTSTITINTELNQLHQQPDPSNSLATNVSQVTVVTSHPPVIIDNSPSTPNKHIKLTKSVSLDTPTSNEVVIISNETNKSQHIQESSTDDDYQSYDSLESSPKHPSFVHKSNKKVRPRKLDESEVLIVSPDGIFEEDLREVVEEEGEMFDTSHVSVVTVGDELIKVKDSSSGVVGGLSELDSAATPSYNSKTNGQIINYNNNSISNVENAVNREDINIIVNRSTGKSSILAGSAGDKQPRVSPDSSVDCSSSMDSPIRAHSENGSVRSSNHDGSNVKRVGISINNNKVIDRSDAESISTNTSHDSRDQQSDDLGEVQLRRKPDPEPPSPLPQQTTTNKKQPLTPRTKEEIHLQNLKKKTRKRTRKFEIDGVQVTTTTSKVIYGDEENGKLYDDHIFRKQELRELKLLQKQEKKQFYDLQAKETVAKEQQDKKFEQERIALERTYEADMDVLARQHRQTCEKYEQQQENELRNTSKKIRSEQERELKLVSKLRI